MSSRKDDWLYKKASEDQSLVNNATFLLEVEYPDLPVTSSRFKEKLKYKVLELYKTKKFYGRIQ